MHDWDGKDFYAVLGVRPSDDAQAIRRAFRRLAREVHPDLAAPDDEQMKRVNEAFHVLTHRRQEYDDHRRRSRDEARRRQQRSAEAAARRDREAQERDEEERIREEKARAEAAARILWETMAALRRAAVAPQLVEVRLEETEWLAGLNLRVGRDVHVTIPPLCPPCRLQFAGAGRGDAWGGPRGDLYVDVLHVDATGRLVPEGFRLRTPAARGRPVPGALASLLRGIVRGVLVGLGLLVLLGLAAVVALTLL